MKRKFLLILSLIITFNAFSQTIIPIEQKIGKLHISIDPRIELLSSIQVISGYKKINSNSAYAKEIKDYFKPYISHNAVMITRDLEKKKNFILAAPVQFILNFSTLPELKQHTDYATNILKRAGNKETLDNYRTAIELFAKESNFEKFWKSNEVFYNKVLDLTIAEIEGVDIVKIVEDYFNEKQNSYNIIISTLAYGSYSYKIAVSNNSYDIYSCNVTRDYKNGIPYIKKVVLLRNISHEFSHSFVDYLTTKHEKRLQKFESLFIPIMSKMKKQYYGNWSTCINEHIIRAINIRMHELNWGKELSQKILKDEVANSFIYIEPIINKLKEFEISRNKNNITFSEFYPRLLDVFDSIKIADQIAIGYELPNATYNDSIFLGPIDTVYAKKSAVIYSTADSDENISRLRKYVSFIFKNTELIPDTVALVSDLSGCGLVVYGTIESNLFLAKYKSTFPFEVKNNKIIADKEYKKKNTRFITCLPNPLNPKYGMIIYTAIKNEYVVGINNVYHGDEDFIIFKNRNVVYSKGYYNKTEKWKFNKKLNKP